MRLPLLADLGDLVLPVACAGCGAERVPIRYAVCAGCASSLESLLPFRTAPRPRPAGLPPVAAAGRYEGPLRGALLAYKERGRHRLSGPLGVLLATAVAEFATRSRPVVLIPVPSTAAAARERHGDHMVRLATHAVHRLRAAGFRADLIRPLRAVPRPDSTTLTAEQRAAAAESSLRIRRTLRGFPRHGASSEGTLVVVDDIVTTGATLAAVASRLREANMQVTGAAVLAATQLRRPDARTAAGGPPGGTERAKRQATGIPNEG